MAAATRSKKRKGGEGAAVAEAVPEKEPEDEEEDEDEPTRGEMFMVDLFDPLADALDVHDDDKADIALEALMKQSASEIDKLDSMLLAAARLIRCLGKKADELHAWKVKELRKRRKMKRG